MGGTYETDVLSYLVGQFASVFVCVARLGLSTVALHRREV